MTDFKKLKTRIIGEGFPLLLVPGGLTGWQSWEPFVELFVQKHRKVILVQLLNVDSAIENTTLPVGYSLKTESHALNAAIDSTGIETPLDIVAWSYGAMTSLDFGLDHPDKVRSLTLIEPPAIWVLRASRKLDKETKNTLKFFNTFHSDVTDEMLAAFLQHVGFVSQGQNVRELPQWQHWLPYRQSLRNNPAVVSHHDKVSRLKKFNKPVLLVKGTGSAPFLHKIIDVLTINLPDSKVIEMPSGHAPHIVSRDRFMLELENFQMRI